MKGLRGTTDYRGECRTCGVRREHDGLRKAREHAERTGHETVGFKAQMYWWGPKEESK